jgi:hypothetical protein
MSPAISPQKNEAGPKSALKERNQSQFKKSISYDDDAEAPKNQVSHLERNLLWHCYPQMVEL